MDLDLVIEQRDTLAKKFNDALKRIDHLELTIRRMLANAITQHHDRLSDGEAQIVSEWNDFGGTALCDIKHGDQVMVERITGCVDQRERFMRSYET